MLQNGRNNTVQLNCTIICKINRCKRQPNLVRETEYEDATGKPTSLDDCMEIDPNDDEDGMSKPASNRI